MLKLVTAAKVNLALAVVGRRADGYHLLDTLVAFAGVGDELTLAPAEDLGLAVSGPFAAELGPSDDNLVIKAARLLRGEAERLGRGRPGAAITLDKRLPIASGLGGGSGDAAAALKGLNALWALGLPRARLGELALSLGADVPMCLDALPARVTGIGEMLTPAPALPEMAMLLVNPGVAVPTPTVFRALARRDNPGLPEVPARWDGLDALVDWLAATRNDLEAAAIGLAPEIAQALAALRAAPGCRLARMSGSGATCFGLFASHKEAGAAAAAIRAARPDWWVTVG